MKTRFMCHSIRSGWLRKWFAVFTLILCCSLAGLAVASQHAGEKERKIGILLVAFGSSEQSAQVSFENIDRKVRAAYPDIPVHWAYTSHIIRKKLAAQGRQLDSPEIALAKMLDQGFSHVVVQSLHTIAGQEFHDLLRTVAAFRATGGFAGISLGDPLLASQEDMERAVWAIRASIPQERREQDGVLLMGHGTHHPSNAFYAALMFQVQQQDANIFIGTVEAYPDLDTIIPLLRMKNIEKVYLLPFMSVAGDHAKNDMAGDDADSWKSQLSAAGFTCVPILKGTAEFDEFVDIWVDHAGSALARF